MVRAKKPDSETGLRPKSQEVSFKIEPAPSRGETGWWSYRGSRGKPDHRKFRQPIRGNWLRDMSETGETFDKEAAAMERMKRGYFNKWAGKWENQD